MAKAFSIKKYRLRARSRRRAWSLKTNPQNKGVRETLEEKNRPVIAAIEAKMKAEAGK